MNFQPMTDEEIEAANLIADKTICYAEVVEAVNYIGKNSGKESIKLKLQIWDGMTNRGNLFVYLTPAFMKLFKRACVSMLGIEKYNAGEIRAEDFEGKVCNVEIGVEPAKGEYKAKNTINDFLPAQKREDDMPF